MVIYKRGREHSMIKKVIIFIVVLVVIGFLVFFCIRKNDVDSNVADNVVNIGSSNEDLPENETKEITIYDIEEGYLTVPYNSNAKKHEYNWDEYLNTNGGYYQYNDSKYESKLGVDVSAYQKSIDWKKVKDSGVEFAILRLGYRGYGKSGKIVLDSNFEQNYMNARKEGIEIGVYFFSQAINTEEVREEANFVLEHLKGKEINYPVAFDLEKIKNDTARTDNLTSDEITDMTLEFCDIIKSNGYTASIYGNAKTFTTKMKLELFNDYCKWYADYQENPLYPYDFSIWQYTETGKIDGITGNVDINIQFVRLKE